jgi:hypothetical protein
MEKEQSGISKAFGNAKESIASATNRAAEKVGLKDGKCKIYFLKYRLTHNSSGKKKTI